MHRGNVIVEIIEHSTMKGPDRCSEISNFVRRRKIGNDERRVRRMQCEDGARFAFAKVTRRCIRHFGIFGCGSVGGETDVIFCPMEMGFFWSYYDKLTRVVDFAPPDPLVAFSVMLFIFFIISFF